MTSSERLAYLRSFSCGISLPQEKAFLLQSSDVRYTKGFQNLANMITFSLVLEHKDELRPCTSVRPLCRHWPATGEHEDDDELAPEKMRIVRQEALMERGRTQEGGSSDEPFFRMNFFALTEHEMPSCVWRTEVGHNSWINASIGRGLVAVHASAAATRFYGDIRNVAIAHALKFPQLIVHSW